MSTCTRPAPYREAACTAASLLEYPTKLFVETTSRCNLSCVMCMKQNHDAAAGDGDLHPSTFAALEEALPRISSLVLNGVGEPLLNGHLEQFIRRSKRLMPADAWVGFQTNGTLLTNMRAMTLVDAGLDRICLSMDGVSPETFSAIRAGGELLDLEMALLAINGARKSCGRPDLQVGVEYVVMRDNLHELPAALRWAAERGVNFALVSHLHPFDEASLSQSILGTCSDDEIHLFQVWKNKADIAGVDICRYFDIVWKFSRSPEEQRIFNFVETMKADARHRGMALDLKRLLELDYSGLEEVLTVFDEAQAVARETGLDLRLPRVVRRERRGCDFVEQGSAFISWDGLIHPCYHLWHQCSSYANGWLHPVMPKVFGSVVERGILEIWNSPEFRSYRENVMRHEYPSCVGCVTSPCDLVQDRQFSQDCYVNTEPCGSCLWSTGVFRCLD